MNKKIFISFITVIVFACIVGNVNVSMKNGGLSDLLLANVEALADTESTESTCKWKSQESSCECGWWVLCDSDGCGYDCTCGDSKWYPNEDPDEGED